MKRIAHKTGLHMIGWISIMIGILGFVLPIIPGFAFILLGVYFISLASLWLWTKIETIKGRFPKIAFYYDKFDLKMGRFFKKAHY